MNTHQEEEERIQLAFRKRFLDEVKEGEVRIYENVDGKLTVRIMTMDDVKEVRMSKVRKHCMRLSNSELWDLFADGDKFEDTGVVAEDSKLRTIAKTYMEDNALSMIVVIHEVWRELAQRGSEYTL